MKKLILVIFLSNLLISCQSTMEGFSLKDKKNADEFLVEKKNPLVLPPDYGNLPSPENSELSSNEEDSKSFEATLLKKKSSSNTQDDETSTTGEFILKNIKKNEANQ